MNAPQTGLRLYAAGSLRAVMTELAATAGIPLDPVYGASGLLRERIAAGEPAEIFASANLHHPQALSQAGGFGPVQIFTRNEICALTDPTEPATTGTLLERMLMHDIRLGMSTPKADPCGDYALEVFDRADRVRPGTRTILHAKALQLTGGADSPMPPAGRNVYAWLMQQRQADIFLTYRTNALLAMREMPALRHVPLPAELAVNADYGLVIARSARPEARRFAEFVLNNGGQAILARHGFAGLTGR